MIHYKLRDINEIRPWSNENNLTLHWFALTDSYYWFNFAGVEFPKYNKQIINEWNLDENYLHVDYYFARIFRDICDVLGYVKYSVQNEVFERINSIDKLGMFKNALKSWLECSWDETDEQYDEVYAVAVIGLTLEDWTLVTLQVVLTCF
ncbi:DUF5984 family protein [Paenibacillus sp. SC116]|uniref:DUF5984 family protein n=1 Tax=Paenibacillus sp. SC116 TaxID=2968986 RepID=UPI00215AFCDC|nr:DUF5984 family protein [Paenibacillus sp. SC116]MCR8843336.1 DUF5984 family protein [Paenibacillus sp. SC116]